MLPRCKNQLTYYQGWQVFCQTVEKNVFFRGKNRTGNNSFCRQKPIFAGKNLFLPELSSK